MTIHDMDDARIDDEVRNTYRELDKATTPAALDDKILGMAAAAVQQKPAARWTQPLAWAATIALCAAIVVQMPSMTPEATLPAPAAEAPAETAADTQLSKRADETAVETQVYEEFKESDDANSFSAARDPVSQTPSPATAGAVARDTASDLETESPADAPLADSSAFSIQDRDLLQSAEQIARTKSGNPDPADAARERRLENVAALSAAPQVDDSLCETEDRKTATDWQRCIKELEAEGRDDDARAERLRFLVKFPDER